MGSPVYNPMVPYEATIHGGFTPGKIIRVQGRVNQGAHTFAINIKCGAGHNDDIAIHISPRFSENCIVRNARIGGNWGPDERHGPPMPLFRDQIFEILILSEVGAAKIAVNGTHFTEFGYRVTQLDRLSHLRIEGDLVLNMVLQEGGSLSGPGFGSLAGGFTRPGLRHPMAVICPPQFPGGYPMATGNAPVSQFSAGSAAIAAYSGNAQIHGGHKHKKTKKVKKQKKSKDHKHPVPVGFATGATHGKKKNKNSSSSSSSSSTSSSSEEE